MWRTPAVLMIFAIWQVTLLLAVCVGLLLPRSSAPVPTAGAEMPGVSYPFDNINNLAVDKDLLERLQREIHQLKQDRDRLSNTLLRSSFQQSLDRVVRPKTPLVRFSSTTATDQASTVPVSRAMLSRRPAPQHTFPAPTGIPRTQSFSSTVADGIANLRNSRPSSAINKEMEAWLDNGFAELEELLDKLSPGISTGRTPFGTRSGSGPGKGADTLDQVEEILRLVRDIQFHANGAGLERRTVNAGFGASENRDFGQTAEALPLRPLVMLALWHAFNERGDSHEGQPAE